MRVQKFIAVVGVALGVAVSNQALAADPVKEAQSTLATFEKKDPSLKKFVENSAGYVVFSTIGKGAVGVGGARGSGVVFERGKAVGKAKLTQLTVGLQLGGQSYSEIIFFEKPEDLADFKKGDFALAAQVSAVALKTGAAAGAKYEKGVAVFTAAKGGLMYEASVGGQKFKYEPLGK